MDKRLSASCPDPPGTLPLYLDGGSAPDPSYKLALGAAILAQCADRLTTVQK